MGGHQCLARNLGETPAWGRERHRRTRHAAARPASPEAFWRPRAKAAACTRDLSSGLFTGGEAVSSRQPAGHLGLRGAFGILDAQVSLPAAQGSAAALLESGRRSRGAVRCRSGNSALVAGRCPERSPGHKGPGRGAVVAGAVPVWPRASNALSRAGHRSVRSRSVERGMPPDPDQPARIRNPAAASAGKSWRRLAGCVVGSAGGSVAGSGGSAIGSLIAVARASRPGSAAWRHGSAARGAPVMPWRRAGR